MWKVRLVSNIEMVWAVRLEYFLTLVLLIHLNVRNMGSRLAQIIHLVVVNLVVLSRRHLVLMIMNHLLLHVLVKIIEGKLAFLKWQWYQIVLTIRPFFDFINIIIAVLYFRWSTSEVAARILNPKYIFAVFLRDREHIKWLIVVWLTKLEVLSTLVGGLLKILAVRCNNLDLGKCEMLKLCLMMHLS